jgi:hypothetical protein
MKKRLGGFFLKVKPKTSFFHRVGIHIPHRQRPEVKPAQPASVKESLPVESRVVACEVISKLTRHINGELIKVCVQCGVGLINRFLDA